MVQYSLGLHFVTEFFLFSQNKTSDVNIGIIAILVHFKKNSNAIVALHSRSDHISIVLAHQKNVLLYFLDFLGMQSGDD